MHTVSLSCVGGDHTQPDPDVYVDAVLCNLVLYKLQPVLILKSKPRIA